jgi:hypothetical protein
VKRVFKIMVVVGCEILATTLVHAEGETADPVALDQNMVVESKISTGDEKEESSTSVADGQPRKNQKVKPVTVEARESLPAGALVSSGERVAIDGKGFSIIAPQGWVVRKNLPRSSLFVQAQVPASQYPRNISVVRFAEPKIISAVSAQEFADRLVASFPQVSSTIEGYSLRSHESIKMLDGREGWLFYTEFSDSGRKMMQAHVLVSSETNHYLATYTDVAEHFDGAAAGDAFLSEAWGAMTSIELNSPSPGLGFDVRRITAVLIGLSLLFIFSTLVRKFIAKRHYRAMSDAEEGLENELDDSLSTIKSRSKMDNLATAVSGISALSGGVDLADENVDDTVEETVTSSFSRIVKLKAKKVTTTPDDDDLEFNSEDKGNRLKRGA